MLKIPNSHTTPPGMFRYKQPETGVQFEYGTWHEILLNVSKHRAANGLDLSVDWHLRLEHEACEQNRHWGCFDDQIPITAESPLAVAGRECWRQLHEFCDTFPEAPTADDRSKALYWMSAWRERIPRFGGCACREDWARLEANYPPDYTSRESLVRWASNGHDWVSRRIGKPLFRPDWFAASPAKDI